MPALLLATLVAAAAAAGAAAPVRLAAPDWTLRCADGAEFSFHRALGQGPVLVSFWALWCAPCQKELPHLDELARETAGRLTVVAVNMDNPRSVAKVRPFLQARGYKLTVPLDTAGDVARKLHVGGEIPFLVLYDREGRELFRRIGYREGDEASLRREVFAALERDAGAAGKAGEVGQAGAP